MRRHQPPGHVRTTLDIDDDVLMAAKERAARDGTSIGKVVSRLARDALTGQVTQPPRARKKAAGRFALLPRRGEVVTLEKVRRLHDDETL